MAEITGVTKVNGVPTQCTVRLYDHESGLLHKSTVSDNETGVYILDKLSNKTNFDILCMNDEAVTQSSGPLKAIGEDYIIPYNEYIMNMSPSHFWGCDDLDGGLYDSVTLDTGTAHGVVYHNQPPIIIGSNEISSVGVGGDIGDYFDLTSLGEFIDSPKFTFGCVIKMKNTATGGFGFIIGNTDLSSSNTGFSVFYDDRRNYSNDVTFSHIRIMFVTGSYNKIDTGFNYPLNDGDVISLAITFDGSNLTIYINGVNEFEVPSSDSNHLTGYNSLKVGHPNIKSGKFDVDGIFAMRARALSPLQIMEWHNKTINQIK